MSLQHAQLFDDGHDAVATGVPHSLWAAEEEAKLIGAVKEGIADGIAELDEVVFRRCTQIVGLGVVICELDGKHKVDVFVLGKLTSARRRHTLMAWRIGMNSARPNSVDVGRGWRRRPTASTRDHGQSDDLTKDFPHPASWRRDVEQIQTDVEEVAKAVAVIGELCQSADDLCCVMKPCT